MHTLLYIEFIVLVLVSEAPGKASHSCQTNRFAMLYCRAFTFSINAVTTLKQLEKVVLKDHRTTRLSEGSTWFHRTNERSRLNHHLAPLRSLAFFSCLSCWYRQVFLCSFQCATWHSLEQYSTVLHGQWRNNSLSKISRFV